MKAKYWIRDTGLAGASKSNRVTDCRIVSWMIATVLQAQSIQHLHAIVPQFHHPFLSASYSALIVILKDYSTTKNKINKIK